jgi:glycosyltransferase involved in cell wall biosynthesis
MASNAVRDDDPPLVTIIVPAYNYAHFVGQTLADLKAQTYANWECLVVDDGSTDDTRGAVLRCAEADARIRYLAQENQGPAAARNRGLAHARGRYVQFLDADDLLETRKIEAHVRFLEAHPEVDIVYGDMRYFRTEAPAERRHSMEEIDRPWMPGVSGTGVEVLRLLVRRNILVINSPLLRKRVIDEIGQFDNDLNPVEDWDYWIRCMLAGKRLQFVALEGALALVRWHPQSLSQGSERMRRAMARLRRANARRLADAELLALNRDAAAVFEGYEGIQDVRRGRLLRGIRQFVRAGVASRGARGKLKWLFCAAAAPFVSKDKMETIVATPAGRSVANILLRRAR